MGDPSSQGNGTSLCCYEDDSLGTSTVRGHLDHADLSLFGRQICDGKGSIPIPFFGGDSEGSRSRAIDFGDLLLSACDDRDVEDEIQGF